MLLEIEDGHGRSSLARGMKHPFAGGRRVSETAKLRQYKYGGEDFILQTIGNIGKRKPRSPGVTSAIFN
jgi:hypothetical protein